MTMPGLLWVDGIEVLNDARTWANLPASFGGNFAVLNEPPCSSLLLNPFNGYTTVPSATVADSPWYDPGVDASERFYGYWVIDSNLDATITRTAHPRSIRSGGANLTRVHRGHREVTYEVLLVGEDLEALRWGFDWLAARFDPDDGCTTQTVLLRTDCGDGVDPTSGLWEMREVGLIDPPKWGDSPLRNGGCTVRTITFTLAFGDPWRYAPFDVTLIEADTVPLNDDGDCGTSSTLIDFVCPSEGLPDQRVSAAVSGPGQRGQRDVVVLIDGTAEGAAAMLVRTWIDSDTGADAELDTEVTTCRLNTGERLLIDSSRQAIFYDDGDGTWRDGSAFAFWPAGTDPWLTFRGFDTGEVWVEPFNLIGHSDLTEVTVTTRTKVGV